MSSNQYGLGTVSVEDGSDVVTGDGTQDFTLVIAGGEIWFPRATPQNWYKCVEAIDANHFRIQGTWSGADTSGVSYYIHRNITPLMKLPFTTDGDQGGHTISEAAMLAVEQAVGGATTAAAGSVVFGSGTGLDTDGSDFTYDKTTNLLTVGRIDLTHATRPPNGFYLKGANNPGASANNTDVYDWTSTALNVRKDTSVTGQVAVTTQFSSVTSANYGSALAATALKAWANSTYGGALSGYGGTYDVSLLNRSGQYALTVDANSQNVNVHGTLSSAGYVAVKNKAYGLSSSYRATIIGTETAALGSVSLCVDVNAITGGNFAGQKQVVAPENGVLVPNAAATDFLGVWSRNGSDQIVLGPSVTSGKSSGPLTLETTGAALVGLLDLSGASSGQIKFPASQNASADANTLDDCEKGTFTPTLTFATPGDLAVTYTTQTGRYTKIGRLVSYTLEVKAASLTYTTASGSVRIGGLPFAGGSGSGAYMAVAENASTAITYAAGCTQLIAYTAGGVSYIRLDTQGSGTAATAVTHAHLVSGALPDLFITGNYEA